MSHYQRFLFLLSKVQPEKLMLAVVLISLLLGEGDSPPGGR